MRESVGTDPNLRNLRDLHLPGLECARMTRVILVALLLGSGIAHGAAQSDVVTTLRTTATEAQTSIFMTLTTGVPALTGDRSAFIAASGEARAQMVRAAFSIARAFAGSAAFAKRYALYRDAQRPRRPEGPQTGGEALARQQQAMEQAVEQARQNAAKMPADARKQLEDSIADMRKQIAELNADPQYRAAVDQMAATNARQEEADFAQKVAAFDTEFPENVDALVARRLRQFLTTCGDVDFDAELEAGADQRQRFVNPAYERRSSDWKMCFRAGKPAVDAARAAADEWLNTLTP
jgi:hypothetical protein